ncbi:MAG: sodium:proton antiporter [Acidobacteria bacterium]|nr:MAG: sodium:proton antiporter [Acidobacteriota bacterium]REK08316.1 MAG: sodium:proton antiporter [Acidobacteriota bacterium]
MPRLATLSPRRIATAVLAGSLLAAPAAASESAGGGHGGLATAFEQPALLIAFALALGMVCQVLARHLRLPGIVLLLTAGVIVGPDVLAWIDPADLGQLLQTLVGFAVAIILFEGSLNLNWRQLRRQATSIRRLVTVGALVTTVGGAVAARFLLGWDWRLSILFGTLVIVTGPTVINPLLRRIRVDRKVSTVLEAEGVFGDAVGAAVAVVALEIALAPSAESFANGVFDFLSRFAIGGVLGLAGGLLLLGLMRSGWALPGGLENVFTLALAVFLFQFSNALAHESGIVCVIAAGFTVGNVKGDALEHLKEFKEQLTVMLIGILFVLLAADVRLEDVRALGWAGVYTVLALMLLVRPLNVLISTHGTDFGWREKAFFSWLAPRGIVAAAVSSLFALTLADAGIEGGRELRALVFLVIAVTVLVQGLSGGLVAKLVGVQAPKPRGVVILGAQPLARLIGGLLRSFDRKVQFIDSNPQHCSRAEAEGFRVLYGSAFDDNLLLRARFEDVEWAISLTPNSEVNFTFARRVKREFRVRHAWVALDKSSRALPKGALARSGIEVLFAEPRNLAFWSTKIEREAAEVSWWQAESATDHDWEALTSSPHYRSFLPLLVVRKGKLQTPVAELRTPEKGEIWALLVAAEHEAELAENMARFGWVRVPPPTDEAPEARDVAGLPEGAPAAAS